MRNEMQMNERADVGIECMGDLNMKKMLIWLVCLTVLMGCTACADRTDGYLSYQMKDATYVGRCTLSDGEYVMEIHVMEDGGRSLTFLSPETVEGCSYYRSPEGDYCFTVDGVSLPVNENPTAKAIFDLFSLDEDDLISASLERQNGVGLNVLEFEGDVRVYLNSADGLPLRFEHPLLTLTLHADEEEPGSP